jgi:glutamate racemase
VSRPIGIFDSGLGGLTVARRIIERLPQESISFVGDEAHIPYGEKSPEDIQSFALGITGFLLEQNAKIVIMACNMSSATALRVARAHFPQVPIIGVIEAGARAAAAEASGAPIGVLATTGTVRTLAYTRALAKLRPELAVYEQPCPKFVPIVESGHWDSDEAEETVRGYVEPLIKKGCRTLVLGCTHYPFLKDLIAKAAGPQVAIIDPSEETAAEAEGILADMEMLNPSYTEPVHEYCTSDSPERFRELGARFMGNTISSVRKITWGKELGVIECSDVTAGQQIRSAL